MEYYVLQAKELYKKYKGFTALNGLTINVPRGAIYGLVGRNGAGKTTLIRLICGLQFPTKGEYELYGIKNTDKDIIQSRKKMGAVVETPAIYMNMTARENLMQQYRILGQPDFSGIDEILELIGLTDTGKKKAKNFSLGMRQRLGIGVALCGNPDFLVLDEPINGLDPQGIVEIRELILKLNKERKITVLVSSHILDELAKLATHYGFVDKGKIVIELSAEELEAECRKCTRYTVTDTKAFADAVAEMGFECKIVDDSKADVYDKVNITQLVTALSEKNCEILNVQEQDESLEGFFISLVGEESNA